MLREGIQQINNTYTLIYQLKPFQMLICNFFYLELLAFCIPFVIKGQSAVVLWISTLTKLPVMHTVYIKCET